MQITLKIRQPHEQRQRVGDGRVDLAAVLAQLRRDEGEPERFVKRRFVFAGCPKPSRLRTTSMDTVG